MIHAIALVFVIIVPFIVVLHVESGLRLRLVAGVFGRRGGLEVLPGECFLVPFEKGTEQAHTIISRSIVLSA